MAEAQMNDGLDRAFPRLVRVENSLIYILFYVSNELENISSDPKSPSSSMPVTFPPPAPCKKD